MAKKERDLFDGLDALPSFPVVLVTVERNIMTAAAFSFYSFDPPCVMVGIIPKNLNFDLIVEKGEYSINLPTVEQLDAVRVCGSMSGRAGDKFARAGLTPQKGKVIDSLLIAECPVSLECQVVHQVPFGGTHAWFVGQIQDAHVEEGYTRDEALMYWLREYRRVGDIVCKQ